MKKILIAVALLAGCAEQPGQIAGSGKPDVAAITTSQDVTAVSTTAPAPVLDDAVEALARTTLASIQPRSIAIGREICGYIGRTPSGELRVSNPTVGELASCFADEPPLDWVLVASFHTHGAYDWDYDSEVPSAEDLEGDFFEMVDGYVATPGGRFWHIDYETQRAYLRCGVGCLPADPNFVRDETLDPVPATLTLDEVYDRFEAF